jgi:drug/metabolite transporter (DMT)-like permease
MLKAILAGLGGLFGWGMADFFAKKTFDNLDSTRTLLWMQIFGILPTGIYLAFNWEMARFDPQIIFHLIVLGIANVGAYLLFYKGLAKGLLSILSPVFACQAAIAVLVSAFLFGEIIKNSQWLGLACAFLGILLVSFNLQELQKKTINFKDLTKGMPEVMAGALIFGFFFPYWSWFLKYQGQGWVTSSITLKIIAVIFLIVLIYLSAKRKKTKPEITGKQKSLWLWLFLIGLFDAAASLSAAWGFRFTTATSVVVILSTAYPLLSVILGKAFLKENLAKNQMVGIAAIIAGLIILTL